MSECTCGGYGDPSWMHHPECAHQIEQNAVVKDRFIMLRVVPTHPMNSADANRIAMRLASLVRADDDVAIAYFDTLEGDGNDLGM